VRCGWKVEKNEPMTSGMIETADAKPVVLFFYHVLHSTFHARD